MDIIDNFLPSYQFKELQNIIMGPWFPWYYNEGVNYEDDGFDQYKHTFYNEEVGDSSDYLKLWDFTQRKLQIKQLYRIKINATNRTVFKRNTGFHVDNFPCPVTALYYINTNNGFTKFKKGGKVKSVENRMVIFDSKLEHAAITCTDQMRRMVVNFNYG